MLQIVNNLMAIVVLVIVAVIFNWRIGLAGTGNLIVLLLLLMLIANKMKKLNENAIRNDLTGQVNPFLVHFTFIHTTKHGLFDHFIILPSPAAHF